MENIPAICKVGDSCLGCPFFKFEAFGNSAYGWCSAPDLARAIMLGIKSRESNTLRITGMFSPKSIIKVPRPGWCPLRVGDFIITQNE